MQSGKQTNRDKFSILSDTGREVREWEVCYWNIQYPHPNSPKTVIPCSIHDKLLLTSSHFHIATVSVRQMLRAIANRHFWGLHTAKWTLALW